MKKEEKYILFGAGIVGMSMLQYYGKDMIVAVIDNNPQKIGGVYEGIPIISFQTYLEKYRDKTIIVSVYSQNYFACIEQMKRNGVKNYFTSPPAIYGLESPEEFARNNELEKSKRVVFFGSNPITRRVEDYINRSGKSEIAYIDNQLCEIENGKSRIKMEDLNEKDTLVLTTNEVESPIRQMVKKRPVGKIADIYQYQEERKEQYKYLEKYKGIYKGRRCFVIGNGPSLREEDLQVLETHQEISFAANGIFHIYDKVSWRPTHYMLCDGHAYKMMQKNIKEIENENAFIANFSYMDCENLYKANRFYLINKLYDGNRFDFSDDAVKGLYSGRTITYVMIQMACYMGVEEIYLLGVDWTGGKGTGTGRVDFYEGNKESIKSDGSFDLFIEEKYAFETALEYAQTHGIKIYNATRGGELEVFERADFDSLFQK